MNFGLRDSDIEYIRDAMKRFKDIEKAVIFGSRAKGNYKAASDVDIAIYGEKINFDILSKLHAMLEEESPMPYFFDIVDYSHLNHKELKEHIDRVGMVIYEK
ncbi:Nucleotidyltransferase domain-containing protein [Caloramator quimbayensis]|uniref:Nucleotidyltransferase domain-containing protein n=1 Tax=Caloramator quimbayensis TaxID=1147123 RepID=A0A1T4WJU4_9CLOT|nr:nucleotidyltransferase domain-containing protein [Caloramator quimbayensis]SKA77592.1 Nucleotidyltransferase domain-containing protein [Caloramator quimbayensis]